jgi:FMN-dependent NADH-azoreductase
MNQSVLHVIASPRGSRSRTLQIAQALLEEMAPSQLTTRNLFERPLPPVDGDNMDSKYRLLAGEPIPPDEAHQESWKHIEELIHEFLDADLIVISAPMWNFSIPYPLKHYIDAIIQPRYLFAYNAEGVPQGLAGDKRMVVVTTRGGDYSPGAALNPFDLQEIYLRTIFGFVGIQDISFIHAQPTDLGPEARNAALNRARDQILDLYHHVATSPPASSPSTV